MEKIGLTKIDIIEAYIEMKLRRLDIMKGINNIMGGDDEKIEFGRKAAKEAYGDLYQFIGALQMKDNQIKERNIQ